MNRYLAVLVAAMAIGLAASAGSAQALTLRPVCSHGAGGLTTDERWQSVAPFYIHISARADSYIAAHGGIFEGHPRFGSPRQVPCVVGESVAEEGMSAWEHWTNDTGNVGITALGITARPYLGRFYCTGLSYATSGRTYETCTHRGTRVGTITVQFVIAPFG